jgi:hypothetical protein
MSQQIASYPNLDAPAWTVLIRAEPAQLVTVELAAGIVGPDLAAEAIAQLEERHLLDKGEFMPVALKFRLWNRAKLDSFKP